MLISRLVVLLPEKLARPAIWSSAALAEEVRNRTGVPRYREHPRDDDHGP
jgi:hypothetical protein